MQNNIEMIIKTIEEILKDKKIPNYEIEDKDIIEAIVTKIKDLNLTEPFYADNKIYKYELNEKQIHLLEDLKEEMEFLNMIISNNESSIEFNGKLKDEYIDLLKNKSYLEIFSIENVSNITVGESYCISMCDINMKKLEKKINRFDFEIFNIYEKRIEKNNEVIKVEITNFKELLNGQEKILNEILLDYYSNKVDKKTTLEKIEKVEMTTGIASNLTGVLQYLVSLSNIL